MVAPGEITACIAPGGDGARCMASVPQSTQREPGQGQENSSFLKKRTKKLLICWLSGRQPAPTELNKSFFGSFFRKRTASSSLALSGKFGCIKATRMWHPVAYAADRR
jgi:hypothetical protein